MINTGRYVLTGGEFRHAKWNETRVWWFKRCCKSKRIIFPFSKCYEGRSRYLKTYTRTMGLVKGCNIFYLTPEQYVFELLNE